MALFDLLKLVKFDKVTNTKKLPEELVENRGFFLLLTCGHNLTAVAGKTRPGIIPDDSVHALFLFKIKSEVAGLHVLVIWFSEG